MPPAPEAVLESFAPLLDALHCGAAIIDRAGRIVALNHRTCDMTALPRQSLLGMSLRSIYDGDANAMQQIEQTLACFEQPREGEFHLPRPDGRRLEVIVSARALGTAPPLSDYRLITLTDISRLKAMELGLKEQYTSIAELSNTILEQAVELKRYNATLEQRVRERTAELHEANLDAIYMLAEASEARDDDTGAHVRRIQGYSRVLARELSLNDAEAEAIGYAAILHDVGKIHIPDHILKKPGKLTDEERQTVQQHTIIGERILSERPFFARARRIARWHHENFDGSGYPDALSGSAIPLEARIVHLADVFDALSSKRVYKHAWKRDDAAAVIRESSGAMFDPEMVRAFGALYERGKWVG